MFDPKKEPIQDVLLVLKAHENALENIINKLKAIEAEKRMCQRIQQYHEQEIAEIKTQLEIRSSELDIVKVE